MTVRPPIKWVGGKSRLVATILPLIPPHITYVEPFGGAGAVLLAKPPAEVSVWNDLNLELYRMWCWLQSHDTSGLALIPFGRNTWRLGRQNEFGAASTYCVQNMCFGGMARGYAVSPQVSNTPKWIAGIQQLGALQQAIKKVKFLNRNALEVIQEYDSPETFFYLDPPYLPETTTESTYTCDLTPKQHEELLHVCKQACGKVLISGYDNTLYNKTLAGWSSRQVQIPCGLVARTNSSGLKGAGAVKSTQMRTESLWWNYAE
jgi:DNA adenine methylase